MAAKFLRPLGIRLLTVAIAMFSTPVVEADEAADELARLQGTWKVVGLQAALKGEGKLEEKKVPPNRKFIIRDGNLIVRELRDFDPPDSNAWPFTLDVTTDPKRMLVTEKKMFGGGRPGEKPTYTVREVRRTAIYALDGNRLKICMRADELEEKTAPKVFPAIGTILDEPTLVFVLERLAPEAE